MLVGRQDAGGSGHTVRAVLASSVRDLRQDQARRRDHRLGGGNLDFLHPHRSMAGSLQLLHQPHTVRLLQQQIPSRIHSHPEEPTVLQHTALLRRRRHGQLLIGKHAEVVVLRDQQLHQAATPGPPGQYCLVPWPAHPPG